jgi:hypothetical protein
MANIQELKIGIGVNKQSALQTALLVGSIQGFRQTNRQIGQPIFNSEDDADDIGKGDEWPTQVFPSHIDAKTPWEYYLTSENAAMLAAFGLGKVTKVAAGDGFKYTCTFSDPIVDDIEVMSTTFVSAMRQGASDIFDYALIGMCLEDWEIQLQSGPGRQNSTMKSNWIGCGKFANPSSLTVPAPLNEHRLGAGSAVAITINGQNYVSNKRFVSVNFGIKKALREQTGFYPGSGSQSGFDIRGRMRHGNRSVMLSSVQEFVNGSTELDDYLAQTVGTGTIQIDGATIGAGPAKHSLKMDFHRLICKSAPLSDNDGIVTVATEFSVQKHATNGVLTMEVTTETDGIGLAAA